MSHLKKILLYQKRFPALIILVPIICSISILGKFISFDYNLFVLLCLLTLWAYFTIRIVDEEKDYEFDLKHHPERPVASGKVSIRDLWLWNIIFLITISICGQFSNPNKYINFVILYSVIILLFAQLSKQNFGVPTLKNNFLAYNFVNSLGNAIILALTYVGVALFSNSMPSITVFIFHFILCFSGSLLLEITRKINLTGPGTYLFNISWRKYVVIFCLLVFFMNLGVIGLIGLTVWKLSALAVTDLILILLVCNKKLAIIQVISYFWYLLLLILCFIL